MSQFETSYPNIDNPEGLLGIPDVVVKKTTFIQPVSGVDPKNPEDYVTKKYYEENTPEGSVTVNQVGYAGSNPIETSGTIISVGSTSNAYGTRYISVGSTPSVTAGFDGDIWYVV